MNPHPTLDRVFPLSQGSSERPLIRPPRISFAPKLTPGTVLGHAAFLRAWSARRAARAFASSMSSGSPSL